MHAAEEDDTQPGRTTSGQDSPWMSQSEWQRTEIHGESTFIVWPILGSRMAEEQNSTSFMTLFHRRTRASYVYNGCLAWYNVV